MTVRVHLITASAIMVLLSWLVLSSCHARPGVPVAEVQPANPDVPVAVPYPPDPVIPPNSVYLYWFSPRQKQTLVSMGLPAFYVSVNGQRVEYTECQAQVRQNPLGRYNDYVLIASTKAGHCDSEHGEW